MKQPEAVKISIGPSNIRDHGLEGPHRRYVANAMVRDDQPASAC